MMALANAKKYFLDHECSVIKQGLNKDLEISIERKRHLK
jgi:hypothetical protein